MTLDNEVCIDISNIETMSRNIPFEDFVNAQFDVDEGAKVTDILVIFSTPRSGSTYLCDLLNKAGVCLAHEYFQPFEYMPILANRWGCITDGVIDKSKYVSNLVTYRASKNGWLGVNLHGQHLEVYSKFLGFFPAARMHYVNLIRNDRIAQAVSYEIAMQTGKWSSYFDSSGEVKYSYQGLLNRLKALHREIDLINSYVLANRIDCKTISYERLIVEPEIVLSEIVPAGVRDDVGIDVSLQKQATELSGAWASEFAKEYLAQNGLSLEAANLTDDVAMDNNVKILFVTNIPPEPVSGGSKRAYSTINALCSLGCNVTSFANKNVERVQPKIKELEQTYTTFRSVNKVHVDETFNILWISCQWSIEEVEYALSLVDKFRDYNRAIRVVIDLSDVLADDFRGKYPPDSPAHEDIKKLESALLYKADIAVWVSEAERKRAIRLYRLNKARTYTIPSFQTPRSSLITKEFDQRALAVCLAGSAHPHNVNSFNVAISRLWPVIRERVQAAELHIFGTGTESITLDPEYVEGVKVLGFVDDFGEQLANYRAHIVPTVSGGGVKTKIFESLSVGTPVVGTPKALEGTGIESGEAAFSSNKIDEIAERTIKLLTDSVIWKRANNEAVKLSDQNSGFTQYLRTVSDVLNAAMNTSDSSKMYEPERNKWITPNVLCQQEDQSLSLLLDYGDTESISQPHRFFHVVNLFSKESDENHELIMQKTVSSMLEAKDASQDEVHHISVHLEEDESLAPKSFLKAPHLNRTVLDCGDFKIKRPLPLVFDIVERGAVNCLPEDFIIFTNTDICLQKNFYNAVSEFINMGFDCITINRRTVGEIEAYGGFASLASADPGKNHPGFDCFVIKCGTYRKFIRNDACVGVAACMRGLLYNMVAFADKMLMLKNISLTYHFGDDMVWNSDEFSDYALFNENQYKKTLIDLCNQGPDISANLKLFCQQHGEKYVPR